jgi:hypothetical protein
MPVLTAEDFAFWEENGYLQVHDVVPAENLKAVIDAIWEFYELDGNDPKNWYHDSIPGGGMVNMYQHQALWDNRQYPKVHEIFTDLLGTEKLWVNIDRASMKPPAHPDHPRLDSGPFIHWDMDSSKKPWPTFVQGVLYLVDTPEEMGGFQCVPRFHKGLDEWIKTQPADRNPNFPDLTGLNVTPIVGKAGDLVIWPAHMAHGSGRTRGASPRYAQYISMGPAHDENQEARQRRIDCWQNRLAPPGGWVEKDPRRWEELNGKTAELTPLGRKLLGLDRWE